MPGRTSSRIWIAALMFACGAGIGFAGGWRLFAIPSDSKDCAAGSPAGAVESTQGLERASAPAGSSQKAGADAVAAGGPSATADSSSPSTQGGSPSAEPPPGSFPRICLELENPLVRAISDNDLAAVKSLVEQGLRLEFMPILESKSPLNIAIDGHRTEIALYLIQAGSPVDKASEYGFLPLIAAAYQGLADVVEALLAKKADVRKTAEGWSALAFAVARNHGGIADMLRRAGAGLTPEMQAKCLLLQACETGDLTLARNSLEEGASAQAADFWGTSALCIAVINHNPAVVRLLLDSGAQAKAPEGEYQPLVCAVDEYRDAQELDTIRLLLGAGADPNAFEEGYDCGEANPLHRAARSHGDDTRAAALLLDCGADPAIQDENGMTALHIAIANSSLKFVEFLLLRKADPNKPDGLGRTPLQAALEAHDKGIEDLLKRFGAR